MWRLLAVPVLLLAACGDDQLGDRLEVNGQGAVIVTPDPADTIVEIANRAR